MKKYIIAILALVMAIVPSMPARAENTLLNGQKHYYTVQLRSDKRAIVYARIIFQNGSSDQNLSTYQFTLPKGVSIENTSVQQILAKNSTNQPCLTYETLDQWRTRVNKGTAYSPDYQYTSTRQCLEAAENTKYDENFDYDSNVSSRTDYYHYSYYQVQDTNFEYNDLEFKNDGSTYTVTLAEPVKPKKQGSVLVAFTTSNFVTGGFLGRYDYNVKTLLTKQMIDRATVAVNFDNDMYTRAAKQKREYESSSSTSIKSGIDAASAGNDSYESRSMDNLLGTIGNGGVYVKTQSSLLSGDTLSVKGLFGTNKTILYTNEIVITLLLIAAAVAAIVAYRRWRKKHPRAHKIDVTDGASEPNKAFNFQTDLRSSPVLSKVEALLIPLAVSVVSLLGTGLLMAAAIGIASLSDYSSSNGVEAGIASVAVVAIAAFGIVITPLLFVLRYGLNTALKWTLVQVAMLLLFALIAPLFFIDRSNYDSPTYKNDDFYIGTGGTN